MREGGSERGGVDNVYGGRRRSRKETEVKFIDFLFLFVTKKLVMSVFEVAILGAFFGVLKTQL